MATSKQSQEDTKKDGTTEQKATGDQLGNTRSDVGSDANPAVDATRVHTPNSDNTEGEELTADNAEELVADNEIAKRNREVGNVGTEREDSNDTDVAKNFNL